jgi:hypothetical protein
VHSCAGHWDTNLNWHEGSMWPQDAILIDLIDEIGRSGQNSVRAQTVEPTSHLA